MSNNFYLALLIVITQLTVFTNGLHLKNITNIMEKQETEYKTMFDVEALQARIKFLEDNPQLVQYFEIDPDQQYAYDQGLKDGAELEFGKVPKTNKQKLHSYVKEFVDNLDAETFWEILDENIKEELRQFIKDES